MNIWPFVIGLLIGGVIGWCVRGWDNSGWWR